MKYIKQIKLILPISFCYLVSRVFISLGRSIETSQSACFANHEMVSFFGIDEIYAAL